MKISISLHSLKSNDEEVFKLDLELRKLEDIPTSESLKLNENILSHFTTQSMLSKKLEDFILHLSSAVKTFEKQNQSKIINEQLASIDKLISNAVIIKDVKIIVTQLPINDIEILKSLADELRNKIKSGVALLASVIENKVSLVCVVSDDLIKTKNLSAGIIVNKAAQIVNGGGGGRAHLATAGGKDSEKLPELISQFPSLISKML